MTIVIIIFVCFFASAAGSICGIGGGVLIRPILDATGRMDVASVSFLSGCTVLSMSAVSLYRHLRNNRDVRFDKTFVPQWNNEGFTRQKESDCYEPVQLDYDTGLPMGFAVRRKNLYELEAKTNDPDET